MTRGGVDRCVEVDVHLSDEAAPRTGPAHGLPDLSAPAGEGRRVPQLAHIQAVVDRLAPRPAVLSAMRWSSVFRISHRIVDRYGVGRVFVAGDAAGEFARRYRPDGPTGFLIRPDGQLGARFPLGDTAAALAEYHVLLSTRP